MIESILWYIFFGIAAIAGFVGGAIILSVIIGFAMSVAYRILEKLGLDI